MLAVTQIHVCEGAVDMPIHSASLLALKQRFHISKIAMHKQTAGPAQHVATACTAQHSTPKHSNWSQHAQHQLENPHLDSERSGILMTAGQEDVAPGEVAMQNIQTMKICQSSSNLPSC